MEENLADQRASSKHQFEKPFKQNDNFRNKNDYPKLEWRTSIIFRNMKFPQISIENSKFSINCNLKNWFPRTWPQDVWRYNLFHYESNPQDRRKVKSALSLIFNIHNRPALDFIRLWSGLFLSIICSISSIAGRRSKSIPSINFLSQSKKKLTAEIIQKLMLGLSKVVWVVSNWFNWGFLN